MRLYAHGAKDATKNTMKMKCIKMNGVNAVEKNICDPLRFQFEYLKTNERL